MKTPPFTPNPTADRNSLLLATRALLPALLGILCFVAWDADAADQFVLPQGVGSKDGSDWENARDASAGGLQAAWDQLQPGETCFLGDGEYRGTVLKLTSGGTKGLPRKLEGVDQGKGGPLLVGDWKSQSPGSGSDFITAAKGASDWEVSGIRIRNYRIGIVTTGNHRGVRVSRFEVSDGREGIVLKGGADRLDPQTGNKDIEIRDCAFTNFTKRGIRIRDGNSNVRIVNCRADAGGKKWALERFHMGYSIQGDSEYFWLSRKKNRSDAEKAKLAEISKNIVYDEDITFENCTASNSYSDKGRYWNGDGFCVERTARNIRYINCKSFDHTDGGWDDKSEGPVLINCISLRNKENFRFWALEEPARLSNCLSAYAIKRGGSGGAAGLWASGKVVVRDSTFHRNNVVATTTPQGRAGDIELLACILSSPPKEEGKGKVELKDCIVWKDGETPNAPQFANADNPEWDGSGPELDSAAFRDAGYLSTRAPTDPF